LLIVLQNTSATIFRCTPKFPFLEFWQDPRGISIVMAGIQRAFLSLPLAHPYHDVVLAVRLWDFHSTPSNNPYDSERT